MAEIIFDYGGKISIQCDINERFDDIIKRFLSKIDNKENNIDLVYIYNGLPIKKELTFKKLANEIDKKRMKMNIIVITSEIDKNKILEISRDIICPECKENALIDIKDFKIHFYGCKNNHKNKRLLNRFEDSQIISLLDIKCNICKKNNKSNSLNNAFYICINCNKNLCSLCKSKHNRNHKIINYDNKNYICKIHCDSFTKYCTTCKQNLCIICENEHKNHDIFDLKDILIDKNNLLKMLKDLKMVIDKFKYKIEIIIQILTKMNDIINKYYKINNIIVNHYDINRRNYHLLLNMYNIQRKNENLIEELNNIINEDKIFEYSLNNFYNENGEKYIGQLHKGTKDGKGILYYNKNDTYKRNRYEGSWKNNMREGKGILYFDTGDKYEGDFKNDMREGKGIMYFKDGNKYEGDFKNNNREGKGISYFCNGDKYDGEWKNNNREGKGIIHYNNGDKYDGEWKRDKKDGKGLFFCANGNKYEGDFKNNKREGKGIFYWNVDPWKGDIYDGDWKNNYREGKGIYYYNNGNKYEGDFKKDKMEGKGILYYNNGTKKEGDWKSGELVKNSFFNFLIY